MMKRARSIFSPVALAAMAALATAATAAIAYERAVETPNSAILANLSDIDPGVDFMITGPVGPTKQQAVFDDAGVMPAVVDHSTRRRMHLNIR